MPDLVTWTKKNDWVAEITLNSPQNLNALTWQMGEQFQKAVRAIQTERGLRVVSVRGAGRAFSSGGDFAFIKANCDRDPVENQRLMVQFYNQFLCITELAIPVIAVLNGPAVGAGLCLALACDLRFAVEDAKLGVNFVRIGLTPGMGSTFFLPRVVGESRASELLTSGRLVSGADAKQLALVHDVYPSVATLDQGVDAAIAVLCQNAPLAIQGTKRLLQHDLTELQAALAREAKEQALVFAGQDIREGIAAIEEKRVPQFKGI